MPDNQNKNEIGKSYQQKAKQNQQKADKYQQQKTNQYQQEAARDFLGNNQTGQDRSGYIIPDMNEEAGMEYNTDKIMKAGKKDLKKKE